MTSLRTGQIARKFGPTPHHAGGHGQELVGEALGAETLVGRAFVFRIEIRVGCGVRRQPNDVGGGSRRATLSGRTAPFASFAICALCRNSYLFIRVNLVQPLVWAIQPGRLIPRTIFEIRCVARGRRRYFRNARKPTTEGESGVKPHACSFRGRLRPTGRGVCRAIRPGLGVRTSG